MESESDNVVTYAPEFECQLFQCYQPLRYDFKIRTHSLFRDLTSASNLF